MDYKSQTCCFTGHRDIAPYTPDTVFEQTKAIVTLLVSKGFKYFGTGGALGFDTIAAQAVLSVKETHPEVKLILVLSCENQTKYWKQQDIDVYNDIKLRADKVKVLAPHYYNGCMQKRNKQGNDSLRLFKDRVWRIWGNVTMPCKTTCLAFIIH